jgi:putative transposase
MTQLRTYVFRLYPTKAQVCALESHLSEAARLYNAALQERREAYRVAQKRVTHAEQSRQLKEIRASGDLDIASYGVAADVLHRVERAFRAFFVRAKERRGRAGFPRFRSSQRYDSITFRHRKGARHLAKGLVHAHGIGDVKFKEHRPVVGQIKTVTIKRNDGRWFVNFVVEASLAVALPPSDAAVGIDVGLAAFATFSDGAVVANPRHFRTGERRLRLAQRRARRRVAGSSRRRKAAALVARAHGDVRRRRADFHHKLSHRVVSGFGLIAVEDLNVRGLARTRLAKSIHDAGWASFTEKLAYKAESAGRALVKVDPRGTSQTCPCGARVPKKLHQRWHHCDACGLSVARDHASAINILALGQRARASSAALAVLAREVATNGDVPQGAAR